MCNSPPPPLPSGAPDGRYHVVILVPGATAIYGLKYVVHCEPGAPPPPAIFSTLFDGSVTWHWTDVLGQVPTVNPHVLKSHWSEGAVAFYDTNAVYAARVAALAVTATHWQNGAPHEFYGDGQ